MKLPRVEPTTACSSPDGSTGEIPSITCVDLFCGAGGLTHGFKRAGLRVTAGIDTDPACRYPYQKNNKAVFLQRDIAELNANEVGSWFQRDSFRVLAGCAPCQPFSTYSQRYDQGRDGKWGLLYEFARLVDGLRPDVVTMENVPSIKRHHVFEDFVDGLRAIGYEVSSRIVTCADYGVPQTRQRMVLLASLHGELALIVPTHRKHRTVRDVIFDQEEIPAGGCSPSDPLHVAARLSPLNLRRIRASKPGGSWRDWPDELIADCHRSSRGSTYPSVYGRMEWGKPAPTITTQAHGFGSGRFGHPEQDRAISLREAALLQGFPKRYRFAHPAAPIEFTPIGRMIGNAVPVDLARAIARSILGHLRGREPLERPRHSQSVQMTPTEKQAQDSE